jgi:hypothetical protein
MLRFAPIAAAVVVISGVAFAEERVERFDRDPGWDSYHNRSTAFEPRNIRQDFGYSATRNAGGSEAGEIGGLVTPAAEPAFYAKKIPVSTFDSPLSASGVLACPGEQPFHALIGFFNGDSLNEWRTPNSIAIRINGRGPMFYTYVEYATSRWRAGGDSPGGFATLKDSSGRPRLQGFSTNGAVHHWSIQYDPKGNNGGGEIVVRIDGETAICRLDEGHKADGARFDHFGILPVMKQWDSPGEIWLDDITINGVKEDFAKDPQWDERGNRTTYVTTNVRPRFDFGYNETHFAGGAGSGELGGLVFRGDIREAGRMAYYGDKIEELSFDKPIHAEGTIALRRAVSDSTALLGFFNSRTSARKNESQSQGFPDDFLGLAVEGPSRTGFHVYPAIRSGGKDALYGNGDDRPIILPDGAVHHWTLDFTPASAGKDAVATVTLDGRASAIAIPESSTDTKTRFDRFGIVTTWIDGNGQLIYFDDLKYTCRQD